MMDKLNALIEKIEDQATRDALKEISEEFQKIKQIPPVTNDLTQVARAVNKITEKI